jgi:hypothetical protein
LDEEWVIKSHLEKVELAIRLRDSQGKNMAKEVRELTGDAQPRGVQRQREEKPQKSSWFAYLR